MSYTYSRSIRAYIPTNTNPHPLLSDTFPPDVNISITIKPDEEKDL